MYLATPSYFTDMPLKLKETNISNEHNRLKNPNWREADQLAIYKHDEIKECKYLINILNFRKGKISQCFTFVRNM